MRDFSLQMLRQLLSAFLREDYQFVRFDKYWPNRDAIDARSKIVLLRHDVDRFPMTALDSARAEAELGITGTYFFRVKPNTFDREIIDSIAKLGHEIGYHYEVMDKAHGDPRRAKQIFISELNRLRYLAKVTTACMHGNPLSRRDNREFWRYYTPAQFDLLGEAYISINEQDLFYATDTGRGWNRSSYNLKDHFPRGRLQSLPAVPSTRDLIHMIEKREYEHLYLLTHPNRWSRTRGQWVRQRAEDACLNLMKALLRAGRRNGKGRHESPLDKPSLHDHG